MLSNKNCYINVNNYNLLVAIKCYYKYLHSLDYNKFALLKTVHLRLYLFDIDENRKLEYMDAWKQ